MECTVEVHKLDCCPWQLLDHRTYPSGRVRCNFPSCTSLLGNEVVRLGIGKVIGKCGFVWERGTSPWNLNCFEFDLVGFCQFWILRRFLSDEAHVPTFQEFSISCITRTWLLSSVIRSRVLKSGAYSLLDSLQALLRIAASWRVPVVNGSNVYAPRYGAEGKRIASSPCHKRYLRWGVEVYHFF